MWTVKLDIRMDNFRTFNYQEEEISKAPREQNGCPLSQNDKLECTLSTIEILNKSRSKQNPKNLENELQVEENAWCGLYV